MSSSAARHILRCPLRAWSQIAFLNEAVGGRNGQCFGFYTYSDNGHVRSENITDWALVSSANTTAMLTFPSGTSFITFTGCCTIRFTGSHFAQNLRKRRSRACRSLNDFRKCSDIGSTAQGSCTSPTNKPNPMSLNGQKSRRAVVIPGK